MDEDFDGFTQFDGFTHTDIDGFTQSENIHTSAFKGYNQLTESISYTRQCLVQIGEKVKHDR